MCLIVCKYMSNRTVHNPNPNPKQLLLISGAITVIFLDEFKRRCKEFHIKERQSSVLENTHSRQTQCLLLTVSSCETVASADTATSWETVVSGEKVDSGEPVVSGETVASAEEVEQLRMLC